MAGIPIPGVPSTIRVPLFYAQFDPSQANTLQTNRQALLIGQITSAGTLNPPAPVTGATSAATALNGTVLTFSAVPAGVLAGQLVSDTTHNTVIPAGTKVLSKTSTTVTISEEVTGSGVSSGDTIVFTTPFVSAPILSSSQTQVDGLCGVGSELAWAYWFFRQNNQTTTLYILPLQDDPAAVAAAGNINIAGTPTQNGTIPLYVDGQSVPVLVTTAMSAAEIATAVAAAIVAGGLTVTSTASSANAAVTANNAGLCGNDIDIRLAYYGASNGEVIPPGLTITVTPMAGGTTNPSTGLTAALALLPDVSYDFVGHPYSDSGSLNAVQAFLNDAAGQWSPMKQLYGGGFTAARGTLGALQTLGLARNDQHQTIMGFYDSPSAPYAWSAALCGMAAASLSVDPAVPCREVALVGILPPPVGSQFQLLDRNTLLWAGISTFKVIGGQVIVERAITTYQLNTFGAPDNSMLSVEKMFTLYFSIQALKGYVTSNYGRMKLADDGTRLPPGANIVTPAIVKASLIGFYDDELVGNGWAQNTDAFAAGLQVARNQTDPDRLDVLFDVIVEDQLNIFAVLAQFSQSATLGQAA